MKIIQISATPRVSAVGKTWFAALYALTDDGQIFVKYDRGPEFGPWIAICEIPTIEENA